VFVQSSQQLIAGKEVKASVIESAAEGLFVLEELLILLLRLQIGGI